MILSLLSKFVIRVYGWRYEGRLPDIEKYVMIVAPHTSMWDFFWGKLFFIIHGLKTYFLMKKGMFFFPLGFILKAMGALPVHRGGQSYLVGSILKYFRAKDPFILIITPEGTRKKTEKWKAGFYYIAQKAEVPVVLGYLDYKKRVFCIGPVITPTGDIKKDMKEIRPFYKDVKGKYPENFSVWDI